MSPPNTYEMFGGDMYNDLRDTYGYSNPAQPSHLADMARLIGLGQAEPDGEYADSIARGIDAAAARDLSNEWMGDLLGGRSTLDFDKWKEQKDMDERGIYGIDQDGIEVGKADHSGISSSTGDGYGATGDPSGRIR